MNGESADGGQSPACLTNDTHYHPPVFPSSEIACSRRSLLSNQLISRVIFDDDPYFQALTRLLLLRDLTVVIH